MDIIIRLIIKIFKEVFEQDSERRRREHRRRQVLIRQWQLRKQAEQRGQAKPNPGVPGGPPVQPPANQSGRTGQPAQKKPDFMRQIEALFGEIAPPEPPPPPPPVPKPQRKPVARKTRYTTTYGQEPKEKVASKKKPKGGGFKLPGKTPLEQLMLAKIILDPCKAMKDDLS